METPAETQELLTPSGAHKVVIKTFLTGSDRRANRRFFVSLEDSPDTTTIDKLEQAEDRLVNLAIVSIDGKTENKVEELLAMHADDYEFVMDAVNALSKPGSGLEKKSEKTSDGSIKTSSEEKLPG